MVELTKTSVLVLTAMVALAVPAAGVAFGDANFAAANHGITVGDDNIEVADLQAPDEAVVGDTVVVTANVSYGPDDGIGTKETTAEFRLDGDVVATQSVTLSANETTEVTFRVNTSGVEPGEYIHGVLVEDSGEMDTITLYPSDARNPAQSFEVSNLSAPAQVTVGDGVQVTADITNPANDTNDSEATTQVVKFRVNGNTVDEAFVTLAPEETTTVQFDLATEGLEPGLYFHGVFSAQFGEVATLEVTDEEAPGTETPTPNATETPTPNATETPTPNATETPTPNATETPTPNATETSAPTEEPSPAPTEAQTPNSTETPGGTETTSPTATEAPEGNGST